MEQRIIDSPTGPVRCRPLKDFPGYWIAENGTVWSTRRKGSKADWSGWSQKRVFSAGRGGYCRISFRPEPGGLVVTTYVHKLVLEAFGGTRPDGMECCHNDGDPKNNRIENLRWGTGKENAADCTRHGRRHVGAQNWNAKLSPSEVVKIRRLILLGTSYMNLARYFGVTPSSISAIAHSRNWKHILPVNQLPRRVLSGA